MILRLTALCLLGLCGMAHSATKSLKSLNKEKTGVFYVQNVYEGTHMEGVNEGDAKYLRIVETPEKRTWSRGGWRGEGEQAPGVNWHNFEVKRIIGDVPVEKDGSAHFIAPADKFLFFQLLDKDKKMIQSMRSGTMLMPGETNGCIGCHEDRINIPPASPQTIALRRKASTIEPWMGQPAKNFSYAEVVQPVLNKHCVACHDWDDGTLVLAGDKNPFFNASYVNLYVGGKVRLVGGGPAETQKARSWGSVASRLTEIIDGKDGMHQLKLSTKEKQMLYTWMDINGPYYPVYETSFDDHIAGRSPLTREENKRFTEVTGVNIDTFNRFQRSDYAQISFDRPEKSPILAKLKKGSPEYREALAILKSGAKRLKETPRGDIESELVVHPRLQKQLEKYALRLKERERFEKAIQQGKKVYDLPNAKN